eukprot:360923-Chlamydomonas_euryale.AAC.3
MRVEVWSPTACGRSGSWLRENAAEKAQGRPAAIQSICLDYAKQLCQQQKASAPATTRSSDSRHGRMRQPRRPCMHKTAAPAFMSASNACARQLGRP